MTIEFRCTTCGKLLRTQGGTEGKKAKCPECGTVLDIPADSAAGAPAPGPREPDFSAPPPHEAPTAAHPAGAPNPYQSPGTYSQADAVAHGFNPTRIDLGTTLGRTWEIYKANLGPCIAGSLLTWVVSFVVAVFVQAVISVPLAMTVRGDAGVVLMIIAQQVCIQAVTLYFTLGMMLFMLRIARGQPMDLTALFGGWVFFLQGAAIQILIFLSMVVGLFLLVVPAVIFALMFSQALFMLVDQRAGVIDSFKRSAEAMRGNKLTVLAIWIVSGFLGLLLMVVTCFIGSIFVAPFIALLAAVVYLDVTGQKTVLDAPAPAFPQHERDFGAGAQPAG